MELKTITPDIAKVMLEKNIGNRPYNKATLRRYVKLMLDGEWGITPDAIGFNVDGFLMNGQHRLKAVVLSGTTQQFFLVEGLPRESFSYTDEGRKRQAGDILNVGAKVVNYNQTASAIRAYIALKRDRSLNGNMDSAPTNKEVLHVYEAHKDVFDNAIHVAQRCYKKLNFLGTKEIGSIYAYLIIEKQYESQFVRNFFEELFFNASNNTTITLLRDRLIKDKMSKSTLRYSVKLSLIAKTWNAYVADRTLKCLKYTEEEGKVRFN